MKTAISVKDDLFKRAERYAKSLKISRSHLYAEALKAYLDKNEAGDITKDLNKVYSTETSTVDLSLLGMALASLPDDEWN